MKDILEKMKCEIDDESVNIYVDLGDDQEPFHVCYWHIDEFEEDASVAISALNAVKLFYTDKTELLNLLGIEIK